MPDGLLLSSASCPFLGYWLCRGCWEQQAQCSASSNVRQHAGVTALHQPCTSMH
jgi:hypothetical protein